MGRVVWTEPGLDDVHAIMCFIAKDSPGYANRLGKRLLDAPKILEIEPRFGSEVPEFGREDIRELLVRPYRVIYHIRGIMCHVVAVVHSSRDLTKALNPALFPPDTSP